MSNDPPSNPDDRDNNTTLKSEASSMLDSKIAKLSLPDNVTMIIVKNANTMQLFFAQLLQKQLALNKISAQDHEGAHLIVKSAKVDKSKHCPITAPKRFQDDKEMKAIQEEDDKLLANLEKTKSSLIRRSASRTLELMKEEFRKLQLTSIRELAIELANTERVRSELLEFKNVPTDVTDVQLGDAAAIEYIATNVREEDAAKYLFKSAKALTTAYAELHNVPMPKEDNPPSSTPPPLTQLSQETAADTEMQDVREGATAEANPLTDNDVCKTVITKTKNALTELWPIMTLTFWDEHKQAEIHRIVNKDSKIRSKSKQQEEANRQVTLNLEELKDNPEKCVETIADAVVKKSLPILKRAWKKESRKKSSGKSKTSQDTKPTKNGQSTRNNSKKKQGQQSNSQQKKNAEAASNNNPNPNAGRGGRGGRNHRGGRGRGNGRGGRGRN